MEWRRKGKTGKWEGEKGNLCKGKRKGEKLGRGRRKGEIGKVKNWN